MELFEIIFDSFYSLTIVTKISILVVKGVVDPTLITDIFASQNWIHMSLKPIFSLTVKYIIHFEILQHRAKFPAAMVSCSRFI